jgi:membrane protein implicated in regulation of membrane protease activity
MQPFNKDMRQLILVGPSRVVAMSATPHLSAAEVAAFVDGTSPADRRVAIERHLAECDECREEVTSCARLVTAAPSGAARRFPWPVILPLAAALVVAVVWSRPFSRAGAPPSSERAAPTDGERIILIEPAPDASLGGRGADARRLVWRAIDGSAGYKVVIKTVEGAEVWRGEVADTTTVIPGDLPLRAGEQYVWRVDGQRGDGSAASSAETGFRVAP